MILMCVQNSLSSPIFVSFGASRDSTNVGMNLALKLVVNQHRFINLNSTKYRCRFGFWERLAIIVN